MKRYLFLAILFLLLTDLVKAQVCVSGRIGIGFYSMSSLKTYQDKQLENLGDIPAQIVSDFPPYINYKAFISFPRKDYRTRFRFYYGYQTTGSRISLADYSGELTLDLVVNGHMVGTEIEAFSTLIFDKIDLRGYFCLGTTTSILKLNNNLEVGEEKLNESYIFYSHGLDVEPGLRATYKYKKLDFGLSLGYFLDGTVYFYLKGDRDVKLGYDEDNLVRPSWDGLRLGIEVSVNLFDKSKKSGTTDI
jgi:hypothetical protein